jgi:hypothetical protein
MPMQARKVEHVLAIETGTERERTTRRQRVYRQYHATAVARATITSAAVELPTMLLWVMWMYAVTVAAVVTVAVASIGKTPCLPLVVGVKAECDKHTPMRRAVEARRIAVSLPLCASATTTVIDPLRPFSCEEAGVTEK